MNRRASLEWSMETTGKLIFYALLLVGIIYMAFKLGSIFISGEKDYRANRNLALLTQRVDFSKENGLRPPESSVILHLPRNRAIIGWGKDDTRITMGAFSTEPLARPRECKKSCLCTYEVRSDGLAPIDCTTIPVDSIIGSPSSIEGKSTTVQSNGLYAFILQGSVPQDVTFELNGETITFQHFDPANPGALPLQLDCSLNDPQSDAYTYCNGKTVSKDRQYYGVRDEGGVEVCWVCQAAGHDRTSKYCEYMDTTTSSVLTCKGAKQAIAGTPSDTTLGPPTCVRSANPDEVFTVEYCNGIFTNPLWTEGANAIGRYNNGRCGFCSLMQGTCTLQDSDQCDALEGKLPQSTTISCESSILHSYYQQECDDPGSAACQAAKTSAVRARNVCPGLFSSLRITLSQGEQDTEATNSFTQGTTSQCVLCNAERDATNPQLTRCWMQDLPPSACAP